MDMSSVDTSTPDSSTPGTSTSGTSTSGTSTMTEKLLGDASVDITDATYRFVADSARTAVYKAVEDQFPRTKPEVLKLLVGYGLAAAVEVAPIQALQGQRQRLAQNLRVQTYQDIENLAYEWGKERVEKVVATRQAEQTNIVAVLDRVQDMINEAEQRTDRHIERAIEQAIERSRRQI
jgi:hypothetical protein